jgi:hypothetical protein
VAQSIKLLRRVTFAVCIIGILLVMGGNALDLMLLSRVRHALGEGGISFADRQTLFLKRWTDVTQARRVTRWTSRAGLLLLVAVGIAGVVLARRRGGGNTG